MISRSYLTDVTAAALRSWAAETPDKYGRILLLKSKLSVTEKLTNGALVTPTPDYTRQATSSFHKQL